jgi:hypothetical protein
MISKCGSCGERLKRVRKTSLLAVWRCACGREYQQRLRQPKGPMEGTTLSARDNLGVSAAKFGPVYVDTEPGSGRFFLSIDLGLLGGIKLRLSATGWKAELPSGSMKGTWS